MTIKEKRDCQERFHTIGTWYGLPYPDVIKLDTPITPKENMKRYYAGKGYLWIPDASFDQVDLTPDNIPDVVACGYGGGKDAFGVVWEPLENGLPALVRPGNPMLKDIGDWPKLIWPDVAAWDWEAYGKKYQEALGSERFVRGIILTGFFERLIALMDFEGAALSYLMNPAATRTFLDKLADLNIEIVEHYKKYFSVDGIMLHDDWGSQLHPLFSLDMVREFLLPPLKRVVERCHQLGLLFTLHSCGNVFPLAPAMIEAGVDGWQIQEDAVGFEKALAAYGSKIMIEGYWSIPEHSEEATRAAIEKIVRAAGESKRGLYMLLTQGGDNAAEVQKYAYAIARQYADV